MTREPNTTLDAQQAAGPDVQLLDAQQVVEWLGLDAHIPQVVDVLVSAGQLPGPGVRMAGRAYWRLDDLEDWRRDDCPQQALRSLGELLFNLSEHVAQGTASRSHERATGPVECAPWCMYGNGHAGTTFRVDQRCYTEQLKVELSQHPAVPDAVVDLRTNRTMPAPDYLAVWAEQTPDTPTRVAMSRGDGPETVLTLNEAQQLVENVQLILGQIS